MTQAVERKYLINPHDTSKCEEKRRAVHRSLADFFRAGSGHSSKRRCEELPFQLSLTRDFEGLKFILTDMNMLELLSTPDNEFDLIEYWNIVSRELHIRVVDVYQVKLENLRQLSDAGVLASNSRSFLENLELIA